MKLYRLKVKLFPPLVTTHIESYTLFGAFCWNYKLLFGENALLNLLERFKKNPPFLFSSSFPCLNDTVYFPVPQMPDEFEIPADEDSYKEQKKFKKMQYISKELLIDFLNGKYSSKKVLKELMEKKGLSPDDVDKTNFKTVNIVRNTINRLTWTTAGGGEIINVTSYFYHQFIVYLLLLDESFIDVKKVAKLLEFGSLGGDKSVGYGKISQIDWEEEKELAEFLTPPERGALWTYLLSPSFPDKAFNYEESYFQVGIHTGMIDNFYERLTAPIVKKRVLYLKTGSVMKIKEKKDIYGGIYPVLQAPSLTNQNKLITIYQYGYAFPLYIRKT